MPSPADLQGKAAEIATNKISWWAKLISSKLSSYGVQYDALDGRSGYGVGLLGGSFDLTSFYDKVDTTPNAFYDKTFLALNSFDMTSLVQAAFEILLPSLDPAGGSMSWIGFAPGRKIADKTVFSMVPVGWQDDVAAAAGVSTPFYKGRLGQLFRPQSGISQKTSTNHTCAFSSRECGRRGVGYDRLAGDKGDSEQPNSHSAACVQHQGRS